MKSLIIIIHTALTAGGIKDVEIATPTNEETLSPRIPNATAAPDKRASKHPTHKVRISPLNRIRLLIWIILF